MFLDEPEPVDSVITFLNGYDTSEYSWVKTTTVSVRLRILFVKLQSTNKGSFDVLVKVADCCGFMYDSLLAKLELLRFQ